MKKHKLVILSAILAFECVLTFAQYPGEYSDKIKVTEKIPVKAYSFNLSDVKLLESPFLQNMERDGKWLLSLDIKRLLHHFRVNAGIRSNAKPYGGWEGLDVLTFKTNSGVADHEIELIPYYKINHQRYVVYWDLK